MKNGDEPVKNKATRIVVGGMGVVCGLIGIQHGLFEILQGNVPTGGIMIDAIGPDLEMWEGARETALTLIPNFLVTGIFATLISLLVIVWSVGFVHRKRGALILFALSVVGLLVGWGITPFEIAILASLAASRINRPLTWWSKILPTGLRRVLARIWLVILIAYALLFAVTISITIVGLGFLDTQSTIRLLYILGLSTLGLMIISVVAGFAEDIEQQSVTA